MTKKKKKTTLEATTECERGKNEKKWGKNQQQSTNRKHKLRGQEKKASIHSLMRLVL